MEEEKNRLKQMLKVSRRQVLGMGFISLLGAGILSLPVLRRFFPQRGFAMQNNKTKNLKYKRSSTEKHWVGDGFYVSTLIHPSPKELYSAISPFLLLDYAAPRVFEPSQKRRGVGEHPHRGFETVTFVYAGEVDHKDSAGGGGRIGPGGVQWMTAASGLVHEEMHSQEYTEKGGEFEMVQLWVNLPAKDKMSKPKYQGVSAEAFVKKEISKSLDLRMVAGEYEGQVGPCKTFTDMRVFDLEAKSETKYSLEFKESTNTLILVLRSKLESTDKTWSAKEGDLLIFQREGQTIDLEFSAGTKILVLNATPIEEAVASYGPFVMNTEEELIQAINDYNSGKMGRL